jgi:hypothetical protein
LVLVEAAQDFVQPQAEGPLIEIGLQLVAGLQAQLAQGKKPVGAIAQIFVCALAKARQRRPRCHRLWPGGQAHREYHTLAVVGAGSDVRAAFQEQQLHQGAG